jgi:hypothetical protein
VPQRLLAERRWSLQDSGWAVSRNSRLGRQPVGMRGRERELRDLVGLGSFRVLFAKCRWAKKCLLEGCWWCLVLVMVPDMLKLTRGKDNFGQSGTHELKGFSCLQHLLGAGGAGFYV